MREKKQERKIRWLWLSLLITIALLVSTIVIMAETGSRFIPNPSKVWDISEALHLPASRIDPNSKAGYTVWINHESVDIFGTWYEANGYKNVESSKGDKVIAPGTEGTYPINLKNKKKFDCKYRVYVKSQFSIDGTERQDYKVPFEMGVSDRNGNISLENVSAYYTSNYNDDEDYGTKIDEGTLKPGEDASYKLSWKWPFERGARVDSPSIYEYEYDNNSDKEDADMTIEALKEPRLGATITVVTEYTGEDENKSPKTGDVNDILPWVAAGLTGLMLLEIALLIRSRREEEEE